MTQSTTQQAAYEAQKNCPWKCAHDDERCLCLKYIDLAEKKYIALADQAKGDKHE